MTAQLIGAAARNLVGGVFANTARAHPERAAIVDDGRSLSYQALDARTNQLAKLFRARGLAAGDRVAILARNCQEYLEAEMAAAKAGVILACLNWRLGDRELRHCVTLVEPKLVLAQSDFAESLKRLDLPPAPILYFGQQFETELAEQEPGAFEIDLDPECGLVILYTSGTTGLPKGALISQRAMIARAMAAAAMFGVPNDDNFIAWPPLYHMASTDQALGTLMRGGTVHVVDGYQPDRLIDLVETLTTRHFILMPGMVGDFAERFNRRGAKAKGVGLCGAMADLVPKQEIAAATSALNAPYVNSFGATETGLAPASAGFIPVGVAPERLSKQQSLFCEMRLVDPEDNDVPIGVPGEAAVRGVTLFSGYWNNEETNRKDFRGGWFHMGDVLRRNEDGTLDYVDRVKYMIKSGGENIYPAEIELVLEAHPAVSEAIVVKQPDEKWSEVPVAFVVRSSGSADEDALAALCKSELSSYKRPKAFHFLSAEELPRSTTGKVQRHILEERLRGGAGE